ncbi:DUF4251 domain-containing protein [Maribacter sp. 2308TA10-17]|uniref:DUF4251 domain-containing protein n=1 Tax=Maribacter sp. 2308TA10-17 TaxID=3386276 RepID=UPI0039BC87CC
MRTKIILFITLLLSLNILVGQSRLERKQLKEEKSQKEYLQVKEVIESDTYEFNIVWVLPMGGTSINVNGDGYLVKITSDSIQTYLPYFGRVYSGVGYGTESGISFESELEDFQVTVNDDKKKIEIGLTTNTTNENIEMVITIFKNGSCHITLQSMHRSTISYSGKLVSKTLLL